MKHVAVASVVLAVGCADTNRELDVNIEPSFAVVAKSAVSDTTPVAVVDVHILQGTAENQIPIKVFDVPTGVRAELSSAETAYEAKMLIYCNDPTPRTYSWIVIAENSDGFAANDDFTLLIDD